MQTLYIMDDNAISDDLAAALRQYWVVLPNRAKDEARLLELVRNEASGYTLDPELSGLPENVRRRILLGQAAEDQWALADVYLIMVQDGEVDWFARY